MLHAHCCDIFDKTWKKEYLEPVGSSSDQGHRDRGHRGVPAVVIGVQTWGVEPSVEPSELELGTGVSLFQVESRQVWEEAHHPKPKPISNIKSE